MSKFKLAAVTTQAVPGDKADNLDRIDAWTRRAVSGGARAVCFPALAVTGRWETSEAAGVAEILKVDNTNPALVHPAGPSVQRLTALARSLKTFICAGLIEDLDYYHLRNSVGVFGPTACLGAAAQVHTPIERHPTFVAARDFPVFDLGGLRAGLVVGDDVLYPEVARCLAVAGAQLLIFALATPISRGGKTSKSWRRQIESLLAARAIENGTAVLAVEASGSARNPVEGNSYAFPGIAAAFSPDGVRLAAIEGRDEQMMQVDLPVPDSAVAVRLRRPDLYGPLTEAPCDEDVPGTRQIDFDAQGELLWSRLRDHGFFGVDLYDKRARRWTRRQEAVVVTAPGLPPLDGYRLVVLTRPCLARIRHDALKPLAAWVRRGGTLVLDGYCGRGHEALGRLVGIAGQMRREVHTPSYEDASRHTLRMRPLQGRNAIWRGMDTTRRPKVWGQTWQPKDAAKVKAKVLATLEDDAGTRHGDAIWRHEVGKGSVYSFAYSTAYSQLLLLQGRGTTRDLGSFPPRVADDPPLRDGDVNTWGDQVVTDAEDQHFPSADYHLLPVFNLLRDAQPGHVLVCPVPDGRTHGAIFTGDSDRAPHEQVNQFTRTLAKFGLRPTQFITREDYDPSKLDADCEYGIHPLFHETAADNFRTLVAYGFKPEQLVCGRRHCLVQYGLTDTLEQMVETGVRYVSNSWDFPYPETLSTAFCFGSTTANHIYNWRGERIGLINIPQVFMDYPPIVKCCQAAYRDTQRSGGVGAWNLHPQNQVMPEQVKATEWLARQVVSDKAWSGTMGEYGAFFESRDGLDVTVDGDAVTIEADAPAGLTLLSPRKNLGINGTTSRATRNEHWHGRKYWVHVCR